MITNLKIQNFILIADLDIDFKPGFNMLIGETGAGKSIIVNALSLLSGTRSQFDKLFDESRKALIEASFEFDDQFIFEHPQLADYLDGHQLVVSRSLSPSKSSQIRLNGELVTLAEAKKALEDVVDISSQGSESYLARHANQRLILDRFAHSPAFDHVQNDFYSAYKCYREALDGRAKFVADSAAEDLDVLRFRLAEIERQNLVEDEIEEITKQLATADNLDRIIEGGKSLSKVYDSAEFSSLASELESGLRCLGFADFEKPAQDLLEQWEAFYQSFAELLGEYRALEIDEEQIDHLNERLYELGPLMKRYGEQTADILAAAAAMRERLEEADSYDSALAEWEAKIAALKAEADQAAAQLSKKRQQAAAELEQAVSAEFADLGLRPDGFRIEIRPSALESSGADDVFFLVGLNKGHPYQNLEEAASGGETSRLMIALKCSFNRIFPADTLIFDEVDTGVSGEIALKVGRKIRALSRTSSILSISHLPPVVAAADHLFLVYKEEVDSRVVSSIKELSPLEGQCALAQMLAGDNPGEEAVVLAKRLVDAQTQN